MRTIVNDKKYNLNKLTDCIDVCNVVNKPNLDVIGFCKSRNELKKKSLSMLIKIESEENIPLEERIPGKEISEIKFYGAGIYVLCGCRFLSELVVEPIEEAIWEESGHQKQFDYHTLTCGRGRENDQLLMKYTVRELLEIAESVNPPDELPGDHPHWCGDETFKTKSGWQVVIFYDCGELDYIDRFVTPEGEEINFWDWPESEERTTLSNWREMGDLQRLCPGMTMQITESLTLKEVEARHILNVLNKNSWNYKLVAKILNIGRSTLWRRLKEYGFNTEGYWNK